MADTPSSSGENLDITLTDLHASVQAIGKRLDRLERVDCAECSCGPCACWPLYPWVWSWQRIPRIPVPTNECVPSWPGGGGYGPGGYGGGGIGM